MRNTTIYLVALVIPSCALLFFENNHATVAKMNGPTFQESQGVIASKVDSVLSQEAAIENQNSALQNQPISPIVIAHRPNRERKGALRLIDHGAPSRGFGSDDLPKSASKATWRD